MKRIIAIALSLVMILSSISVVAAPTDRAQAAMDYIGVFTGGTRIVTRDSLKVETVVGKTDPTVHSLDVLTNEYYNFSSTLDMSEVREIFNGMKTALTLERPETQALFADAEVKGTFVIVITSDADINYSNAKYGDSSDDEVYKHAVNGFIELEESVFKKPVVVSSTEGSNKINTLTVDTVDGLLLENLNSELLGDIKYTVSNAKSTVTGTHEVAVTMDGYVNLLVDDTVIGTINFITDRSGEDHKAAVVVKPTEGGGGAIKHTVTFETNGGTEISPVEVFDKHKITLPTAPTKDGYTFEGWYVDEALTIPFYADSLITKNITLYAKWTEGEGVVGDDDTADVIVKGEADKEVDTDNNVKVSDLEVPERDGFIFGGWYEDPGYNNQLEDNYVIEAGDKVYGRWVNVTVPDALEDTDHFAYIIGYPDETVRPQRNVSREEVATMFYRLMKPDYRAEKLTRENDFPDIEEGRWSEKAVATMANAGFVKGYPNGTFKPENSITRAEFATIAARMFADDYDKKYAGKFNDIAGHWAEEDILKLSAYECIYGYEDGSFKPDAKITRAEAIAIINRIIVRYVNHEGLHEYAIHWVDNVKGNWYYYPMLEATNSHDYSRQTDLYNEDWHEMNSNIDWEADQYN